MTQEPETQRAFPEAAIAALHKGSKIEAIKIVRMARGIGLKESKEAVEAYIQSQPMLERKMAELDAVARRGLLPWVILAAAIAAGAYHFLSG